MTVLYVAFGDRYIREAAASIRSLRRYDADRSVVVYASTTDTLLDGLGVEVVVRDWRPGYLAKIRAMAELAAERFVFLDTDTRITGPLDRLFGFISLFGFAAAPDPIVDTRRFVDIALPWPDEELAPELNSGVIAINRTLLPPGFFEGWIECQQAIAVAASWADVDMLPDQLGLRRVLAARAVAYGLLPVEFNFRACYPQVVAALPLIIHSRMPDPALVEARLRNTRDITVWFPFGLTVARTGLLHKGLFAAFRGWRRLRGGKDGQ